MLCDSVKFSEKKISGKKPNLNRDENTQFKLVILGHIRRIVDNFKTTCTSFSTFSTLNMFSRWLVCNKIIHDLALIIQNRNTRSVRNQTWIGNRLDGIQVTLQLPRNIYYKDSFPGNNMIYNKVWFEAKLLVHNRFFLGIRNVCWEYN